MAVDNFSSPPLRVATHNTQGLNSPSKRRKVLDYMKSRKIDILFLQETHFPIRYNPTFLHAQFPLFYLANAEDKTRGVAILISKSCRFTLQQVLQDPEGRYILVKGSIEGRLFSLVSYYAPNAGQLKFFSNLFKTLDPLLEGSIIFGRDSNVAFDQGLDRSKPPRAQTIRPTRTSSKIAKLIYSQGLTDIWRDLNPTKKDYTHFSHAHQSYARLDHLLVSNSLIPSAQKAQITDTVWSNHSLLSVTINNLAPQTKPAFWRLPETIISDPIRKVEIEKAISDYFTLNDTADVSAETLWAAHKATIRGKLIQISSQIKREHRVDIDNLEKTFHKLCSEHKRDPVRVPVSRLDAARLELNLALTVKAEKRILW